MNKKTGRKTISFILTLAMVFSMLTGIMPGTSLTAYADGTIEGSGTQENPFIIKSEDDLAEYASDGTLVNSDSSEPTYVSINNDFNLSNTVYISKDTVFVGTGKVTLISGIYLSMADSSSASLTIDGPTFVNTFEFPISGSPTGTVTVKSGSVGAIQSNGPFIMTGVSAGFVFCCGDGSISGGTVGTLLIDEMHGSEPNVEITGGTFDGSSDVPRAIIKSEGRLVIKGGKYKKTTINDLENELEVYLAEGYSVTEEGDYYVVSLHPDKPTNVSAVNCTSADNNDGKLKGVTTAMEYKLSTAENWIDGTGEDITGLVPGTYYVRVKATETSLASDNLELTIREYIAPIPYVYYSEDGIIATKHTDGSCTDYTTVTDSTTDWSTGWYVVSSDVTVSERIYVDGTANLILCDGATLIAEKGIGVNDTKKLIIYAQDNGTGALSATGYERYSGIGGWSSYCNSGTVTIHGGTINATGGKYGAGIGSGLNSANGGIVTIYSGNVNATGGLDSAGIGGGGNNNGNATCGTVTIFGGTVTATGNSGGAGIGSGDNNNISGTSGVVTINGGTVTATGDLGGAGIGGGWASAGCNVTINGGTVIANGAQDAMGIGRGKSCEYSNGELTLGVGVEMKVSTDNSTWTPYDANNGARTRYMTTGDLLSVTITPDSNMTKTTNSGAASQTCIGAMTAVVYTANDGYYFPEDYSATAVNNTSAVNGITVTRDSISQITVSGTPTADTEITLTAPSLIVPTGVSLDKHEINVNDHDGNQTLTATISPDGATGTLVWSSSNSSVASVASNDDNTATVTIEGVGTANITVTIQGTSITDVCTVNVAEYVCPHDNKIEKAAKDATCTESGNNKYYYCEDCNKYLKADGTTVTTVQAETIPALGHNYEGVAYSLDDTRHWKVCSRCFEDSAKENHSFGNTTYTWSNDYSTCTAFHTCEVCGKEVREIVNTTSKVTQATCTNSEITKYTASFTNDGFEVQTKDVETGNALGHVWSAHWYEWSDDYSTVTAKCRCTRADCNETQTETVGTSVETTATCTEAGTTTYTATFTNETFNDDSMFDDGNGRTKNVNVDSLGHDWKTTVAVPATCTTAGNKEYKKCNRCGEYNVEENSWVLPALGHSFVYDANGATVTATCEHDRCKYKNTPAKLTIVAPTLTTVGGKGSESATLTGLTDFNTATGLSVSADSIRYFKATKNGTTYTKSGSALTSAPTDAGDYLAEITVSDVKTGAETTGNVTAGLGYTIAKEAPIHSDGTISTSGIYCMSNHPSIKAGMVIQKSNEKDTVEYRWVACDSGKPGEWFEVSPWTKDNNWIDWTPEKSGAYVLVCYARVVGNEEASLIEYSFGTEYHKGIKGICQMPYTGEGGGYLIGIESFDNPNNSYQYEMLILDCSLLAQGKDAWIYSTGRCGAQGNSLWTVWQPEYGYYWTLFRIYDSNGNLIDETCYGFANIY